eukprot:763544-Hanusia_phi.AAC.2
MATCHAFRSSAHLWHDAGKLPELQVRALVGRALPDFASPSSPRSCRPGPARSTGPRPPCSLRNFVRTLTDLQGACDSRHAPAPPPASSSPLHFLERCGYTALYLGFRPCCPRPRCLVRCCL